MDINLEKWEYYILSYLSTLKKFRTIFNKCFSHLESITENKMNYTLDDVIQSKNYNENSNLDNLCFTNKERTNKFLTLLYNFFIKSSIVHTNSSVNHP